MEHSGIEHSGDNIPRVVNQILLTGIDVTSQVKGIG